MNERERILAELPVMDSDFRRLMLYAECLMALADDELEAEHADVKSLAETVVDDYAAAYKHKLEAIRVERERRKISE